MTKSDYNRHATAVTRDERIAGNPTGHHAPRFRRTPTGMWDCLGCAETHASPALYCEECVMHTQLRP